MRNPNYIIIILYRYRSPIVYITSPQKNPYMQDMPSYTTTLTQPQTPNKREKVSSKITPSSTLQKCYNRLHRRAMI